MIELLLPALLPAFTDGIRGIINKFTGGAGAAPSNPEDVVKLMDADIRRMEALAKLEGEGTAYPWVEAIRKLQRPFFGLAALLIYAGCIFGGIEDGVTLNVGQWVQMFGFYLFGDRAYMYLKQQR